MEYDPTNPTRPLVMDQANFEEYFNLEMLSMAVVGYANRRDAAVRRERAMLILVELLKKEPEQDDMRHCLALNVFDRFSSRDNEPEDKDLELVVISCYFLASKMRNKYLSLDQFLTARPHLLKSKCSILEMANHVLLTLNFTWFSINPFGFLEFFLQKLPPELQPSQYFVNEILIEAHKEMNFTEFKPSVIAASAIVAAGLYEFPEKCNDFRFHIISSEHIKLEEMDRCLESIGALSIRKTSQRASSANSDMPSLETASEGSGIGEERRSIPDLWSGLIQILGIRVEHREEEREEDRSTALEMYTGLMEEARGGPIDELEYTEEPEDDNLDRFYDARTDAFEAQPSTTDRINKRSMVRRQLKSTWRTLIKRVRGVSERREPTNQSSAIREQMGSQIRDVMEVIEREPVTEGTVRHRTELTNQSSAIGEQLGSQIRDNREEIEREPVTERTVRHTVSTDVAGRGNPDDSDVDKAKKSKWLCCVR